MAIANGAETRVNSYTEGEQYSQQITALSDGGWVVTWASSNSSVLERDIYQQVYNADGSTRGGEAKVSSVVSGYALNQKVAALADGGWVVIWQNATQEENGIYQQIFDDEGKVRGEKTKINTDSSGSANFYQIKDLSNGGWVVSWSSYHSGENAPDIRQRFYSADGTPHGEETQVNTFTIDYQYIPVIAALSSGGWVVTWRSKGQDGSGYGVYQQAYSADGVARGEETRINTYAIGDQLGLQITALADGGWVATWMSDGQDEDGWGVYQQAYDADGTAQGGETRVNSYTTSNQYAPEITALPNGGWVVTWMSEGQDEDSWGVYQQAYNADGTAHGGETRVNSYTASSQAYPQITALSDGGWVVTWRSEGQDGSGWGIYQQAYDADGTAQGGETRVNSYTTSNQYVSEITALPNGGWVVTWQSYDQDGSRLGVYQRTFWLNDAPTVDQGVSDQTTQEDGAFSFTVPASAFADADALDTLTYSATLDDGTALPAWLTFDAATRTFSGTPANGDVGAITVKVTATDAGGLSASTTFSLSVENTNDAPVVPAFTTVSTFENAPLVIDVLSAASDDDGDTLTVTAASVLSGFGSVFIDDDGRLRYDPTTAPNQNIAAGETRTVVIRYTVSDGNGGTATPSITVTVKGVSPDLFRGTPGNDTLTGSIHGDILYGYAGNDTLDGKTGADQMRGGTGDDTYVVDNTADTVVENANEGTDLVKASVSYTLAANVENLTLTGSATNGTGNGSANILTGNSAANTLDGKAGADRMIGGKGNDTYIVDNAGDVVVETADAGTDLVKASVSYTLAANAENLTLTGSAVTGIGNTLANILTGNDAANTLDGKAGADRMIGGKGNDIYIVDNAGDIVVEGTSAGTDLVKASVNYTLAANVENLTLTGLAKLNGTGNTLANILTGNDADNVLDGKTGADRMVGGKGNDIYIVDNAGDAVVEGVGAGTDLVKASVNYTLGSNVETLTLTGTAAIGGYGNALNNIITGNGADNTIEGAGGTDTLIGGAGNDRILAGGGGARDKLYGGTGADTFVFTGAQGAAAIAADNLDIIFDFSRSQGDKIDLKRIDANTKTTANDAFSFIQTEKFHKKAGELRYEIKDGDTFISGDTNGDGTADFSIRLDLSLAMKGTDFIL